MNDLLTEAFLVIKPKENSTFIGTYRPKFMFHDFEIYRFSLFWIRLNAFFTAPY